MRWPWLPPSRGDIAAIIVLIGIGVALILGVTKFRGVPGVNAGFGPDWDCTSVGKGSVCMKRVPASPTNETAPSN
jgi:hypothetical protein